MNTRLLSTAICLSLSTLFGQECPAPAKPACCEPPPKRMTPCNIECDRCGNRWFFEADFIYWMARQEGNEYAATGAAITVPDTIDPNTSLAAQPIAGAGSIYSLGAKWEPGFKAALGLDLAHGGWDLFAEYTYLHTKTNGSVSSDNINSGILPLFAYTPNNSIFRSATFDSVSGATGFVSMAEADWTLNFNNITLELRKDLKLCPTFALNPRFGLQGTWQKQEFSTSYTVSSFIDPATTLGSNQVDFKQTSWGIGLRGGVDSNWNFAKHWGLFANPSASLLWSEFNANGRSHDTNTLAGYTDVLIGNQTYRPRTLVPVMELEIGAQFDWTWCKGYELVFQAGWEGQFWFFQNQHSSSIANTSLILQGLTTSLQFTY